MSNNDPLLQFLAQDASSTKPSTAGYKIAVVVGGVEFRGHVVHPDAFLEEMLRTEELTSAYGAGAAHRDASEYLHLLADKGPDINDRQKRHVRFRMDGIDAWWAE
ncbi:hypothetical protein [Streptomyces sp. 7N604]|uniref:hypothetical protein n=1 Tax=Streptomyces sp. 7N604 TaxID=3457415 RepID=UPI003FD6A78B